MAESNQRTARAQKALKAQKAQSGAAKAKARQEEEALLRADFIVLRDPVTDNGEALARNAVSEVFRAGALIHRAPR